eukprot:gnl/TRDRNA2_/TRDRNA2_152042_c0_seq1.p1 gnl/TRDRNA2_/TRDRNA2_152042_c0~~gnl/TRDRNA2_/TRDRNA2_152042_c0_seq1.p1  ORF type:complete len:278 (-),score=68.93 gnl/TRDRNA2_/TRDRNA2_152042_c0_seq1:56-889(-)
MGNQVPLAQKGLLCNPVCCAMCFDSSGNRLEDDEHKVGSIFATANSVFTGAAEEITLDDRLEKELANEVELWRMDTANTAVHMYDMSEATGHSVRSDRGRSAPSYSSSSAGRNDDDELFAAKSGVDDARSADGRGMSANGMQPPEQTPEQTGDRTVSPRGAPRSKGASPSGNAVIPTLALSSSAASSTGAFAAEQPGADETASSYSSSEESTFMGFVEDQVYEGVHDTEETDWRQHANWPQDELNCAAMKINDEKLLEDVKNLNGGWEGMQQDRAAF